MRIIIFKIILIVVLIFIFFLKYNMSSKSNKIIVFDMDETLGQFSQFSIIVNTVEKVFKKKLNQNEFNNLLDIFPFYLRTDILKILNYLKNKKIANKLDKVIIFTNNQGPKEWSNKIKNYFNYKVNYNLFDQVIGAYMINEKHVEKLRTSHNKRYTDLIKIAKLPLNSKICFIDDLYHIEMENKNLYYINIAPYEYEYKYNKILLILKKKLDLDNYYLYLIDKELINNQELINNDAIKYEIINQKKISKELFEKIKLFF